jgi:hypothetical protein
MRGAMFSFVTLAVLLMASAVPAQPTPTAQDSKAIHACLDRQEAELGQACIGIVADPCLKASNGETAAARACVARELAVWEAQLAAALRRVQSGGFKELSEAVRRAQESWQASRRALCPAFDKIDPGMFPGGADRCSLHETAGRALLLRRLGDAVNEH